MTTEPKPFTIVAGEPWWNFEFAYSFEGSEYIFHVCARSVDEAHQRLKKIAFSRYEGQCDGGPIPLWRGGFFVPLIVWWRNRIGSRKR